MAQSYDQRLLEWWEGTEQKLKRRWWLWPVVFAIDLIWHRLYGGVNEFLGAHSPSMLAPIVGYIPAQPVPLAIVSSMLILLALAAHAYFETRKMRLLPVEVPGRNHDGPAAEGRRNPEAEVLRVTMQLNAEIDDRDTQISTLREWKNKSQTIASETWELKEAAREIKRRWPGSPFEHRPVLRASWAPQAADQPWLTRAVQWHKRVSAYQPIIRKDFKYLNSLDFDEVMELIDSLERAQSGLPVREIWVDSHSSPFVYSTRYAGVELNRYQFGLYLRNIGEIAHTVEMVPLRIGKYTVSSDKPISTLLSDQGELFLELLIRDDDGNMISGDNLAAILVGNAERAYGPILRLIYHDVPGNSYVSRHELQRDIHRTTDSVLIEHINVEMLAMPDSGAISAGS